MDGDLPLLELLLDLFLHIFTLFSTTVDLLFSDDVLEVKIVLHDEAGGHHVVVVHELHEGLHVALAGDALLAHLAGHLAGVALNADHEGVGELAVLKRVISEANELPSCHRRCS